MSAASKSHGGSASAGPSGHRPTPREAARTRKGALGVERTVALYRLGNSLEAVAREQGISVSAVRGRLHAFGVEMRRSGPERLPELDFDEVRRCNGVLPGAQIAKKLGVSIGTLRRQCREKGIHLQRTAVLHKDLLPFVLDLHFNDGLSLSAIARELHVGRPVITTALTRSGRVPMTVRELAFRRFARMTPEQRRAQAQAANQATRKKASERGFAPGRSPRQVDKAAYAAKEATFDALRAAGLEPSVGHRVGEHRLDLSFPEARLCVEVRGRRWSTRGKEIRREAERSVALCAAGWRTLSLWAEEGSSDQAAGWVEWVRRALPAPHPSESTH